MFSGFYLMNFFREVGSISPSTSNSQYPILLLKFPSLLKNQCKTS